jgi:hypothetical protein
VVTWIAVLCVQVQNALHMGWVDYCAALITAKRMQEDIDGRTLIVHNGDVSYAECVCIPPILQPFSPFSCFSGSVLRTCDRIKASPPPLFFTSKWAFW